MARIETWLDCDLLKPAPVLYPEGRLFSQDNKGNLIGVRVTSGGEPVSLTGNGVTAYCILADGSTVPVAGSISTNKASVVLPEAAYAVPGLVNIIVKLTNGTDVTTIGAIVSTVFGMGNVINPTQSTIDAWKTQINTAINIVENNSVRYDTTQSLTDAQKARAKANIDAVPSAVHISGEDYKIVIP